MGIVHGQAWYSIWVSSKNWNLYVKNQWKIQHIKDTKGIIIATIRNNNGTMNNGSNDESNYFFKWNLFCS
jgi:hypothetical protein